MPHYLRTSLEAYQKEQGYEAAKSGAVWATLGRLLKRLEEEAPSKGTGKGSKSRYRIHLSNRSGPCGRPKGRGQSRSPRNGGRSWAGSRQRQLPQDQQRQQQEPALWMAARAGDTEKCQQLLAAGAEVHRREVEKLDAIDGRSRAGARRSRIAPATQRECSQQKRPLGVEFCSLPQR